MISVKFLKNSARMQELLKKDPILPHGVDRSTPAFVRKELRFFPEEICRSCKEKLNLNSDRFIKEK